ncbi:YihY/virulence factor BrkB family protein [Allocoleopsis franciscana]|uniref:Putative membrane protein n=1 Tax=Allocoleopsis franciscana PCC 7113 TaxID=1173027 RepID=K9WEZ2_9CYAN|nr:YihY/virulence factor BrkB family protein [Allocoleopsis franciscana]AFZ18339.1 putative membrane protein [Allocoleopsis franciscana PCC 7113]
MKPKVIVELLKETFKEWQEDKASRLAAALAYYTAFSIAPLLIIAIAIAALVFGEEAARGGIEDQLRGLIGQQGAEAIEEMIKNSSKPAEGTIATIISVGFLLFGASGVFAQLQDSLNTIWEVAPKPGRGVMGFIKDRFLSFSMVLGIGFLLLVSLVLSAVLAGLNNILGGMMPGLSFLWEILNFLISFGVITLLFALIYRVLPDAKIAWGDVWFGAIITALLFTIGKTLIGLYLGNSSVGSTYGAAGSFVVLLLWVNYSAQILFFGAELTQVYANKYGSHIVPTENAVRLTEEDRVQQGIPHSSHVESMADQERNPNRSAQQTLPSPQRNRREKRNPAATALGGLMGMYQSLARLTGRKKNRNNRHR